MCIATFLWLFKQVFLKKAYLKGHVCTCELYLQTFNKTPVILENMPKKIPLRDALSETLL